MAKLLQIINLEANIGHKKILKGIDLTINTGEIHVIMGPNGSGKSTLAHTLMGNPKITKIKGKIIINGQDISEEEPSNRVAQGLFLTFQHPREIDGINFSNFLFSAYKNIFTKQKELKIIPQDQKPLSVFKFNQKIKDIAQKLSLKQELLERSINKGFSGGEKKKAEMLQLELLNPSIAILDEIDSGLDIDSLKIVAESIKRFMEQKEKSLLIITHYQRLLQYLPNYKIHIIINGKIIDSGNQKLASELEQHGYQKYLKS